MTKDRILFEVEYGETLKQLVALIEARKKLSAAERPMRQALVSAMKKYGLDVFVNESVQVKFIPEKDEGVVLDVEALKKSCPGLYESLVTKYPKKTNQADAYIRVTFPQAKCQVKKQEMVTYMDSRGWKYRVMRKQGDEKFKARYFNPSAAKPKWVPMSSQIWRNSMEEAQADLDAVARKENWQAVEGRGIEHDA